MMSVRRKQIINKTIPSSHMTVNIRRKKNSIQLHNAAINSHKLKDLMIQRFTHASDEDPLRKAIQHYQTQISSYVLHFVSFEKTIEVLSQLTYLLPVKPTSFHLNHSSEQSEDHFLMNDGSTFFCNELRQLVHDFFQFAVEKNKIDGFGPQSSFSFSENDSIDLYRYENFLAYYHKPDKKRNGAYYTPPEAAVYLTKSTYELLKRFYGIDPFDTEKYLILDFAAGSGSLLSPFITSSSDLKIRRIRARNLMGFEKEITPLLIGRFHMESLIGENFSGYHLVNALDPPLEFFQWVLDQIYDKTLIIIGNPPYKGISHNNSEWIANLINDYKYVGEDHFRERKHWLNDDYVKFIRLGQRLLSAAKNGTMLVLTNHSFLDNPTFRGMRYQLLKSFDHIRVLDLNGNNLKNAGSTVINPEFESNLSTAESSPTSLQQLNVFGSLFTDNYKDKVTERRFSKDQNIFEIETGVAVTIFSKFDEGSKLELSDKTLTCTNSILTNNVAYFGIRGDRGDKLSWLQKNSYNTTGWKSIDPAPSYFLFKPFSSENPKHYEQFIPIRDIFIWTNIGIVSARDRFCMDHNREVLLNRMLSFRNSDLPDAELALKHGIHDTTTFKIGSARQALREISPEKLEIFLHKISYRPWDERWIFYHPKIVERRIFNMMKHMLPNGSIDMHSDSLQAKSDLKNSTGTNRAIVFQRGCSSNEYMNRPQVTRYIIDHGYSYPSNRAVSYIAPLYLFSKNTIDSTSESFNDDMKETNITHSFKKLLFERIGGLSNENFDSKLLFGYIYGILNTPEYLMRYSSYLQTDFPRIPLPPNEDQFFKVSHHGSEIIRAQLLEIELSETDKLVRLSLTGNRLSIERAHIKKEAVFINDDTVIRGLTSTEFNFEIGGYQAIKKYLTARKHQNITPEDLKHLSLVKWAMAKTLLHQSELSKICSEWI